jgi:hypothetical protein
VKIVNIIVCEIMRLVVTVWIFFSIFILTIIPKYLFMKKQFYFLSFFLLAGFMSQAQFKKGDVLLGGDARFGLNGFGSNDPNKDKQTSFDINPSIGKFINDHTMVGVQAGFSYGNTNQNTGGTTNEKTISNTYSAGVFMRRYRPVASHFYVFLQTGLSGSYNTVKSSFSDDSQPETKNVVYLVYAGLAPGISYGFNDRLMLELSFPNLLYANYSFNKSWDINPPLNASNNYTWTNHAGLGTALNNGSLTNVSVGFRILLGNKPKGA